MKTITKEFKFDSSHRLIDANLSVEENMNVFGKCYNAPSHGHTYKLFVTISGRETNGMIINFTDLKRIVNEKVIDIFDHHFINDVECMKDLITTCEVMVDIIWNLLETELKSQGVLLEEIKLYETETSFATRTK
jgi:6-pyruvoyltetrahydropterin/6-carboxytetrahydropterin synthase